MIECESIQGYRVEKENGNTQEQILRVVDETGYTIADHLISPQNTEDTIILCSKIEFPYLNVCEYIMYQSSLQSHLPKQGIGFELWKYAEMSFYQSQDKPYLRFIHDLSDDGWTQRKIPQVIEYLQFKNIPIQCVWQGNFIGERMAWILLFEQEHLDNKYQKF